MSDSDDDYALFGTPVEELDEDELRKKKAPRVEDQIAKDKQGRRRFHGAFTGGFSAGFFNSVGSKEGWTPSTFVSSRGQRADSKAARPQDFMDDEDLESYGISPQGIQATSSFDSNDPLKRKRVLDPDGPIPGVPVLEDILKPARETVGMKILQKLGWKPGQGVGPRVKSIEKFKAQREKKKIYGCQLPLSIQPDEDDDDDDDTNDDEVTFAPDDVQTLHFPNPKSDQFGLGYKPLDRTPVLGGHINLFDPNPLSMKENKKKVLIKGQAFGVGAFEDDDEDIYGTEDMSNYDFGEEKMDTSKLKPGHSRNQSHMSLLGLTEAIEGFKLTSKPNEGHKPYPKPSLPKDFIPQHQPRKRRFERKQNEVRGLGRHEMTPEQRARLIADKAKTVVEIRSGVKGEVKPPQRDTKPNVSDTTDIDKIYEEFKNSSTKSSDFKPFAKNPEKQRRYDLFLRMKERGQKDRYYLAQPKTMTEWEREREVHEFSRASQLFQPLTSTMANRFVTAAKSDSLGPLLKDGLNTDIPKVDSLKEDKEIDNLGGDIADDRVKAAKMNMYGKLTQVVFDWYPERVLCRRFNVPNPYPESSFVGVRKGASERVSIFNVLNAPIEDTAGLKKEISSPPLAEEDSDDHSDEKNDENQPETYGLKVPVDGPPTMDLFKAIFQDSDSDSDDEGKTSSSDGSDDEMSKVKSNSKGSSESYHIPSQEVEHRGARNAVVQSVTQLVSSIRDKVNSDTSDRTERVSDPNRRPRVSRFEPAEKDTNKEADIMPKPVFVPRKKAAEPVEAPPAKGIFANIDFEALNSYRNFDSDSIKPQTEEEEPKKPAEKLDSDSSVDSEDEYGPPMPSHLKNRNQMISSTPVILNVTSEAKTITETATSWIVKDKKKKSSKKHKHKDKHKHKKEKKKKKQKEKKKKHRRSRSDSSSDSSASD